MDQGVAANKNSQNSQFFRFRRAPWRLEELSLRWTGSQQDVWSWKPKDFFENQQLCEQTKQNQSFQQSLKQTRTLFSSADYATSSPDQTGLKEHNQLHLQYSPFLSFACTKHGVRSLASAGACQKLASHSCLTSGQDARQWMSEDSQNCRALRQRPAIQSSGGLVPKCHEYVSLGQMHLYPQSDGSDSTLKLRCLSGTCVENWRPEPQAQLRLCKWIL